MGTGTVIKDMVMDKATDTDIAMVTADMEVMDGKTSNFFYK